MARQLTIVRFAIFLCAIWVPSLALAQPADGGSAREGANQGVAVTAPRSREAIENFVAAFATPTHMTGKIARWESGICPLTVGQQPAVTKFVTQRIKEVAALVGVPVDASPSCAPNIDIVFTKIPQELLDNIRKHQPDYLGYATSAAEMEKLATVTRPLQAWYATQTKDRQGLSRIDKAMRNGEGAPMSCFTCVGRGGPTEYLPDANYLAVTGDRISDGVRSAFYHVVIVADINRLSGYEAGPLADYIAMLALTQLNSLDTCQSLPSVENMLAKGCESKTGALTANDIAYLRGLYKMSPDRISLISQKSDIADRMNQSLP